jgi:hypothetical protein
MKRSVDDRCELKAKEKGIEMRSPCSRAAAEMFRDRLDRYALKRASLLHLIDLKRGGHSPRRTELQIERLSDRPVKKQIDRFNRLASQISCPQPFSNSLESAPLKLLAAFPDVAGPIILDG